MSTYQWPIQGGGPGGPGPPPLENPKNEKEGPPCWKSQKCKRGHPFWKDNKWKRAPLTENVRYLPPPPPLNRAGVWRSRKNSATIPPPHWIATVSGDQRKFLLLPPPPPLNRDGFRRSQKIAATTPPPTESRRPGTSHERGPLLRKILDLRLHTTYRGAAVVVAISD